MAEKKKITLAVLRQKKAEKERISMLTAYDYPLAKILDQQGIDLVLVGDSLGNVVLGYRNTLPVTMEEMIIHTKAVARGVERAFVVADLPFGSFQLGIKETLANAVKLLKAGAQAVKIEGANYLPAIKALIRAGIPVMGHLGFTPQSVNLTGVKIEGRRRKEAQQLLQAARSLEQAGCFALVLELVEEKLAERIARTLKIPVIGIGSGSKLDGQVLVTNDLIGLYENPPSFVKPAVKVRPLIQKAVADFIKGARSSNG